MFENLKEKNLPTKTKSPIYDPSDNEIVSLGSQDADIDKAKLDNLDSHYVTKKATPACGRNPKKPKEKDEVEELAENLTCVLLLYLQVSYDLNHRYRFHKGNRLP